MGPIDVINFLNKNGIKYSYYELQGGARTVEEAAKNLGCTPSEIAKNIVFKTDDEFIVVICRGDRKVSMKKLTTFMNRKAKLANPEEVFQITGYQIGGVPPFNHSKKLRVLIDTKLLEKSEIITSGGSPHVLISLKTSDLIMLSEGKVVDVSE